MLSGLQKLFGKNGSFPRRLINNIKFEYTGPKKKRNLSNPFEDPELNVRETASKEKQKYGYLQFGMYGLIVAGCFAAIPLYRLFCEHVGLVGNYEKKTYEFKP
jgi:hypothetical protein